ncbi:MAG: peptidylprolyl isomerase [Polyangiaceae bacterium]
MERVCIFASFSFLLAGALASAHCGGAAPCAAAPASSADIAKAAATECLAIARVKRQPSPSEPTKITAKHVLVMYQGAKTAKVHIVRFKDEACVRAMQARDELRNGADFAEIVKKYSDEPGAESRGGSIGTIERKDVVPSFADAAFELAPREFSDVVESEFGFHVIYRSE